MGKGPRCSDTYEFEFIDESGFPNGRPLDMNRIRFEDPPGGENVKIAAQEE
jgi:hypothetical protein